MYCMQRTPPNEHLLKSEAKCIIIYQWQTISFNFITIQTSTPAIVILAPSKALTRLTDNSGAIPFLEEFPAYRRYR